MKKFTFLLFIAFFSTANAQQWVWGKLADSAETFLPAGMALTLSQFNVNSSCMAADNMGNFFLATNLRNSGANIGFSVIKLNAAGNQIWKTHFFGEMTVSEMAFSNNNLYVGGTFSTGVIGTSTLVSNGKTDVFIASLNPSGVSNWVKTYGGNNYDDLQGLCSDVYSNVYATGNYQSDSINFGNTTHYSPGNTYLLKSNSSGNVIFSRSSHGGYSSGTKVRVDKNGYIYVLARYIDIRFNTDSLKVWGYSDDCIIKFDPSGNYMFMKDIMNQAPQIDMEINSFGNMSTTGMDYGNHSTAAITQCINDTAHVIWNQGTYSTCYNEYSDNLQLTGVAMKGNDTYVTGTACTPYCQTFGSVSKFMFNRYDQLGNQTLFDTIKFTGSMFSNDIITDSNGDLIVSGIITGSISFDNHPVQGNNKIYIAKYSSNTVATSISKIQDTHEFSIFPNPARQIIIIKGSVQPSKITLLDLLGIKLQTLTLNKESGTVDLEKHSAGVYLLQIESGEKKYFKKLVIE